MKIEHGGMQFHLPGDLRDKLVRYRQRVWTVKTVEAVGALVVMSVVCYLAVFVADRLGETPAWLRALCFGVPLAGLLLFLPWKLYRWIWGNRQLTQLARLLAQDQPRVGDRLLGVIELVENRHDRHMSPALCQAAIGQVADDTRPIDFLRSVPHSTHRRWSAAAALMLAVAVAALLVPGAGINALWRWLTPWSEIPRYTFAQLVSLPDRQVVPIGEPFTLHVRLAEGTIWAPRRAQVRYGGQPPIPSERAAESHAFVFEIPAQTHPGKLKIAVGDARHTIAAEPKPRPELTSLLAHIQLPPYLGYDDQNRDARTGAISIVKGSRARFEATASRPLAEATVNGERSGVELAGERLKSPPVLVEDAASQEFRWTDIEGLSAKSPFTLRIRAIDDRAPAIQCSQLTTDKVILDEETLSFDVAASDDFGVRAVGVEWEGIEDPHRNPEPQHGEYLLAGGAHQRMTVSAKGAFSPKRLGVEPQPIHLRVFAEDYLPGRPRVYSPIYRLYVLDRHQHMIWVTQQLEQWQRQALEVRDEEERLLETNQQLRQLTPEQLDRDDMRQQIARQAAAERANAQRLQGLTAAGEQLIGEATRNPEFNVTTLENWAQVLQTLKQLATRNMPSVASQLANAGNASKSARPGSPPAAPSVSDPVRGAARDPDDQRDEASAEPPQEASAAPPSGSLQLPATILPGSASSNQKQTESAGQQIEQAVEEQERLLAEFNRVMDQLAQIMQDLQGSTFVKRLKAAADAELSIAADLHEKLQSDFGSEPMRLNDANRKMLQRLYAHQSDTARDVRLIQEDLAAYFERTRQDKFKQVHDEMKSSEVVSKFKSMSTALIANHSGDTIAQAEYWSDQLDRWAELLVGPGCANCGPGPGGKGDSLPPAIVLEVLRILKGEIELRDATRVAEQTRTLDTRDVYQEATGGLRQMQEGLHQRTELVMQQLERLQVDEGKNYGQPLRQLATAADAMEDASGLLAVPQTGAPTIAAETEAIEALLIAKRAKQGGGGGGGGTPGGGSGVGPAEVASALAGLGDDLMSQSRDVAQSTGSSRSPIPEEFRAGLDAYFSALDGQENSPLSP
jgi:hypothetical protein